MPGVTSSGQSYYSVVFGGLDSVVYFFANVCALIIMCGAILAWMGGAGVTFNIDNAYIFWHWWCVYGGPAICCCGLIYIIHHITYELRLATNFKKGGAFIISSSAINLIWFIYTIIAIVLVAFLVACIIYYGAFIVAHCASHSLCYGPKFMSSTVSVGAILWLAGTCTVVVFALIAIVMCLYLWFSGRRTTMEMLTTSLSVTSKIGDKVSLIYDADAELYA